MLKYIMALTALAAVFTLVTAPSAQAQAAPYQDEVSIAAASTSVTWDAPAATYGPLLSLQAYNLTNGATLAVKHIIKASSTVNLTNTVETAASGGTLLVYPAGYLAPQYWASTNSATTVTTPVKPVWLAPGDKLLFTTSIAHGSDAIIVIRAGHPGD